jgi:hypothetical protein
MATADSINSIAAHMRALGLGALAHANSHANYWSYTNDHWPELSVVQAAHAGELLIKARIAEEHPLLIFERFPKIPDDAVVDQSLLARDGRTFSYDDLPNRLLVTAGVSVPAADHYREFGRLRNSIQHFLPPTDVNLNMEALRYIYAVVDPFINECWGLFAIDFNEDYEPYRYLVGGLLERGVPFLVSPEAAADMAEDDVSQVIQGTDEYRVEMLNRFKAASRG